jgi:hypothetical protein
MNKSGAATGAGRSLEATSLQIVTRLRDHCLEHPNSEVVLEAVRVLGKRQLRTLCPAFSVAALQCVRCLRQQPILLIVPARSKQLYC